MSHKASLLHSADDKPLKYMPKLTNNKTTVPEATVGKSNSTGNLSDDEFSTHVEDRWMFSENLEQHNWKNVNIKNPIFTGNRTEIMFNGNKYQGQVKDGKPHGEGIIWYKRAIYKGFWQDGEYNGTGELQTRHGPVYNGVWIKGKFVGGKKMLPDGTVFMGRFFNERLQGLGTFVDSDGSVLRGNFENGIPEGKCHKTYKNGNILITTCRYGIPLGPTELRYVNGDIVRGIIIDSFFYGHIRVTYARISKSVMIHGMEHSENITCEYFLPEQLDIFSYSGFPEKFSTANRYICSCRSK